MKILWRIIVILGLAALGVCVTRMRQDKVTSGYPFKFVGNHYEFGTIRWRDAPSHSFRFTNTSQNTVTIQSVETECACTDPEISAYVYRPGQSGTITLRLDPAGLSGRVTKSVHIRLRGFNQPVIVSITADVIPRLSVMPSSLDLGKILPGDTKPKSVVLRNTECSAIVVRHIESSDYIHVTPASAIVPAGGEIQFRLSLRNPPVGKLRETLKLYSSLKKAPLIEIPVTGEVWCAWRLSRPDFYIGFVKKGERPESQIVISGLHGNQIIGRTTAQSAIPSVVNIKEVGDGVQVSISLDLDHAPEGMLNSSVLLTTNDARQSLIRIPITGSVQDPSRSHCCGK